MFQQMFRKENGIKQEETKKALLRELSKVDSVPKCQFESLHLKKPAGYYYNPSEVGILIPKISSRIYANYRLSATIRLSTCIKLL